jgi:hypothetical protein
VQGLFAAHLKKIESGCGFRPRRLQTRGLSLQNLDSRLAILGKGILSRSNGKFAKKPP